MEGDIILGGLFPVRSKSDENENACGVLSFSGYQYMEGMMFAIDQVNANSKLLQNITLGAHIYDTCGSKTIAANSAKDFIKMTLVKNTKSQLAGVVGASSSEVSKTVANFLRVFEIPQISYDSTSISLSNKDIYSYFLRTVPPDSFQAQAMVDLCKEFGWNYVSTVNAHGAYGTKGIEEFWKAAESKGECTTLYHTMPCHTIPYHTIPYHTIPYHTIPYHTIPYHTIPYHTIPYHTIPYHTIPYHTIPYHTIPHHTIPCITITIPEQES